MRRKTAVTIIAPVQALFSEPAAKMDMNMPVNVPVDDPNADTEW